MKRLDRYIGKTVILSMLVVIAIVYSLDLIFTLVDELVGTTETYTLVNALSFVAFTAPSNIYQLLPFTALGGALIGLGILASNNELIVIQAAGVKVWRIVYAILKPTFVVMALSLLIGEYIAPPLEQLARSNKAIQLSDSASVNSEQGTWHKVGNDYIHINAIAPGGALLYGVTRYRIDAERQVIAASFAESADYVVAADEAYWRLYNVRESLLGAGAVTTQQYLQEDWKVDLSPQLLSVLLVEPQRQSISGLYKLAQFFQAEGLESGSYFLAFWKKLMQPLSTLALVILGVSFVFGPLREATMGFRLFVALAIGLGFTIVERLLEPASLLYGFNPVIAVLMPILVSGCAGFYLLQRVR
jgi:lipopolysaccharide export system permease protein